jgi:RNA polymerase-binding protein DksA
VKKVKKKLNAESPLPESTAVATPGSDAAAQVGLRQPLSDDQLRKSKSGLTKADLQRYRSMLLTKRAELLGDVEALESDVRNNSGDHFSPEHMADTGSNNYEQEFTLGLVESEQKMLREIDEALLRLRSRTYGVCAETGKPIGKARLDAKSWAKYCIEVAREKERFGQL